MEVEKKNLSWIGKLHLWVFPAEHGGQNRSPPHVIVHKYKPAKFERMTALVANDWAGSSGANMPEYTCTFDALRELSKIWIGPSWAEWLENIRASWSPFSWKLVPRDAESVSVQHSLWYKDWLRIWKSQNIYDCMVHCFAVKIPEYDLLNVIVATKNAEVWLKNHQDGYGHGYNIRSIGTLCCLLFFVLLLVVCSGWGKRWCQESKHHLQI